MNSSTTNVRPIVECVSSRACLNLYKACLVPHGLPRSCVVVDIAICRAPTDTVLPEFLMLIINEQDFRSKAVSKMTGTTRKRLSRKNLASIEFHLPLYQTTAYKR